MSAKNVRFQFSTGNERQRFTTWLKSDTDKPYELHVKTAANEDPEVFFLVKQPKK